jgi:hypothetical protein
MRLVAAFFLSVCAFAQSDSRASEIEAERQKKADSLKPETLSKGEAILHKANDMRLIERTTEGIAGLHIVLGNMVTGSGFALGPEYIRRDLKDGNIVFRTAVRASTKQYLLGDAQLTFPKLFGGLAYADLYTAYHSFTDLHYYGSGPETGTGNRGHYLKETGEYVGRFGINVFPRFQIGGAGAFLKVNTGPGTQQPPEFSIEQRYTPQEAIGVDRQAHYARAALYAQYDWRDNPGGLAKKGGFYNTIQPEKVYEYTIDFWRATGNVFLPGHRIRIEISSSYFPYYLPNLNTGADNNAYETKPVVARQKVYHTAEYPSHVVLPVIPRR